MTYDHLQGRADLLEFAREQPSNFWQADPHLRRIVRRWAGAERLEAWAEDFDRFGAQCAGPIDAAVRENNLTENLPRPERWGPFGERLEQVAHHPAYHAAGRLIYGSGVMKALGEPGSNLRAGVLAYLSSLNGEAGQSQADEGPHNLAHSRQLNHFADATVC